jgi:hypothetical protein
MSDEPTHVISDRTDEGFIHVIPIDDWREHELTLTCWCHPVLDEVVLHNSVDRREEYERGERKPS